MVALGLIPSSGARKVWHSAVLFFLTHAALRHPLVIDDKTTTFPMKQLDSVKESDCRKRKLHHQKG